MQFLTINDVTLHYSLIRRRESSRTVVFINSLGTDFRIWDAQVAALTDACSILLYDKRGHGLSDLGNPPYAMEDHVDDLEALIDRLGLTDVVLCGLSVGGMIAQGLAARRPDLVTALVLCDTAHKIGTPEMWRGRMAELRAGGLTALLDGIMERWFTPAFRVPSNPVFAGCCNMLLRQDLRGYEGTCAAIADADLTDSTRRLRLPTLCVAGESDLATPPELVRELAGLIAGSEFAVIPGAGHIPGVEQPEIFNGLLQDFLRRNA
jgi:3-oxoadipate enol-lactonase